MTTFTWTVDDMYTIQQPNPNYVVHVDYIITATDGEYVQQIKNPAEFLSEQESEFIPYEQLTEAIVIGWVQTQLGQEGVSKYETFLQEQIEIQLNEAI